MIWSSICSFWRRYGTWRVFYSLFLGQVVSFTLALMSFTSSLIASLGVDTPLTQSLFVYVALALIYGCILLYRRKKLQVPWYWYILLGFVDVQGNFLDDSTYRQKIVETINLFFTELKNSFFIVGLSVFCVTLLDCFTIPWVIILTYFFLRTRYSLWQLCGAGICILGLGLVLLSDAGVGGGGGSRPLLGDFLVIAGTLFFAMSNVGEEFCVKKKDRVEVVGMIGVFGMLVSVCEISILERKNLESIKWSVDIILAFAGYALSGILFYTLVPFLLKLSGATMFNLSALTSDMWAVIIRIFFYRQTVDWLYFISFAIVVVGLILYSTTEKKSAPLPAAEDRSDNVEYRLVSDENSASGNESLAS